MVFYCKLCGRILTSAKSIKLKYGPICYKKIQLNENHINIQDEINFLKIEIKMLKKVIRELKINDSLSNGIYQITKIRQDNKKYFKDKNTDQMLEVIQELKRGFQTCGGNVKNLLRPIQIEVNTIKTSEKATV